MLKKLICLALCLMLSVSLFGCVPVAEDMPDATEPPVDPPSEPTYYLNPLTGIYNLDAPYTGRPYAISVNNITVSLPQYGVSVCDIMVEIETEGGITRLMCLFTDPAAATNGIGSIRSLRHQFVQAVSQWNPVIVHIGTSDYCQDYLYGRGIKTMNGFYSESFLYIDAERRKNYDSEHTKFTNAALLDASMESFDLDRTWNPATPTAFSFADADSPVTLTGGSAVSISAQFSKEYDCTFQYDAATSQYVKYQHGNLMVDGGNNAPVAFDNLLVLFADTYGLYGELIDVDYGAGGRGLYLCGGQYEEISWVKNSYDSNFILTRADGSALQINPGRTYLGIVRSSFYNTLTLA